MVIAGKVTRSALVLKSKEVRITYSSQATFKWGFFILAEAVKREETSAV